MSLSTVLQFGCIVIPPYSMPCLERYPIDATCKYPGIEVEMYWQILGPFSLQPRFIIFDDYDKKLQALQNSTIDAASMAIPDDAFNNFSTSIFPWVDERPEFFIRKPLQEEMPRFMIFTTFSYQIWTFTIIFGAILLGFQRFIQRKFAFTTCEKPVATAWWFVLGILL